jgi:hypothetical protein
MKLDPGDVICGFPTPSVMTKQQTTASASAGVIAGPVNVVALLSAFVAADPVNGDVEAIPVNEIAPIIRSDVALPNVAVIVAPDVSCAAAYVYAIQTR